MTENKDRGKRVEVTRYSPTHIYTHTHTTCIYVYKECTQTDDKDTGKRMNRELVEGKRHV